LPVRKLLSRRNSLGFKMILPPTALIACITLFPLINGLYLGMTNTNILRNISDFVGIENYVKIILTDGEFYGALSYTAIYSFFVMAFSYILGLIFALLLNRDIKLRGLFRAAALIPWIIPPIVATTNWSWVLNDQYGIINTFLKQIGFIKEPILFLAMPNLARMTVIGVGVWKSYPFMMIVLLAGLQSIPKELYEAAYIDGAGFVSSFWKITMPNLKNVSFICTILMFIWTFNNFENIYLLTQGGPVQKTFVLSILSYYMAFFRGTLGYASAITTVMLVVLLLISMGYLRVLKANEV